MTPASDPASPSATLSDLLLCWRDRRDRGEPCGPEQLCPDRPELHEELRRQIDAIEAMERRLNPDGRNTLPMVRPGAAVPTTIAGYEVLEEIGRGGMGVVYKARQKGLNRLVALKMILAGAHAGPQHLARFGAEAAALARLRHPNIVQVYETGEHDGLPFLSLEYVEGGSLDRRLNGKPLPPADAARLVQCLALAMHAAHQEGIVHRDLKPANVLLQNPNSYSPNPKSEIRNPKEDEPQSCSAGTGAVPVSDFAFRISDLTPKVTDFGLAKLVDAETHTHSGSVLGTPCYMAPEQAQGRVKDVGPATDVYALGAILYECLTGGPPFTGESAFDIIRQVIGSEPASPSRQVPKLPRDLEVICLKCLHKEPGQRYASARELADDLGRFLDGRPIEARSVTLAERGIKWARRRPERATLLALLLLMVLLGGVLLWNNLRHRPPDPTLAPRARVILLKYCFPCHGRDPDRLQGDLHVLVHDDLLQGRIVVPGDARASRLLERIEDGSMPPEENEDYPRLSLEEQDVLRQWIDAGALAFDGPQPEDFTTPEPPSPLAIRAQRVLSRHCHECHRLGNARNGVKVLNHDLLVEKRRLVVPGSAEDSPLWRVMTTADHKKMMPPPKKPRLKEVDLKAVRDWIDDGAKPFPLSEPAP